MSDDFKVLLVRDHHGRGVWQASSGGNFLYLIDGFRTDNNEIRINKSKKGNPFMIRIHQDSLMKFRDFINELCGGEPQRKVEKDPEVPF